jgi:2-oxoglutarate dehydrogenase E1 component
MDYPTFASRWNLDVIEDAYERWRRDATSVEESWRLFFEGFELGATSGPEAETRCEHGIVRLIDAYRQLGHFLAHLDPLSEPGTAYPLLELSEFGLEEVDLERTYDVSPFLGLQRAKLRELLAALRETYCRTIGVEYMHIQDTRIRRWLQERMEPARNQPGFGHDRKVNILKALHYAETFERFLHTRYVGQKRFSLEGGETLIPLLEALLERAPEVGVREIVLGMALLHRCGQDAASANLPPQRRGPGSGGLRRGAGPRFSPDLPSGRGD